MDFGSDEQKKNNKSRNTARNPEKSAYFWWTKKQIEVENSIQRNSDCLK